MNANASPPPNPFTTEAEARNALPVVAGPVVAWRTWGIHEEAGQVYLTSIAGYGAWPIGSPNVAHCQRITGERYDKLSHYSAPVRDCSCGIWAMKDPASLKDFNGVLAIGRVALWGHLVEAQFGYRAQFAYPVDLMAKANTVMPGFPVAPRTRDLIERLSWAYGVPIVNALPRKEITA